MMAGKKRTLQINKRSATHETHDADIVAVVIAKFNFFFLLLPFTVVDDDGPFWLKE